jgi:hypothetical protein
MARLFVFGIGGTGARIIKSLTMLLASGMKTGDFEVIPILIDPHESLEELNNCKKLLKLYGDIHEEAYKDVSEINKGYFFTRISTLASIAAGTGIKDGFSVDGNYSISFGQFLEKNNFPQESKTDDFLSLLFSQSENFNKSLSVGFKGNPNVGSIVLNTIKDSQFFKAFETAFGLDDRVFIISSIFGGTGAAGFPLLLKILRQHSNMKIRDSQIGALTVMPYFKLSDPNGDNNTKSDIDSKNFLTKTKSALTYYIKNITNLNALYYIADPDQQAKGYVNNELEQKNNAHLAEVLGALSVIHFSDNKFTPHQQEVFEYCLDKGDSEIHFKNISKETRKYIAGNLTSIYLLNRLHQSLKEKDGLPFRKTSSFDSRFFNDPFFNNLLEDFLDHHFEPWLKQLSENERGFNPFNLSNKKDFSDAVKGFKIKKNFLTGLVGKPFDDSDLFVNMAKWEKRYKYLNKVNKKNQYLSMAYDAINKSIEDNLTF